MKPLVPQFATVYSLLSAWARCQQIDVRKYRASGNRGTLLDRDFSLGGRARWLANVVLDGWLSPAAIIDHHTHVPLFSRLMKEAGAVEWRVNLLQGGGPRDVIAQGIRQLSQVESSTLRRCPTCMAHDQHRFGHAHWRLHHQWPVARHCVEHGDALETCCAACKTPFMRDNMPKLADDPCPMCGCTEGIAKEWTAPSGYWPLLQEMFSLLHPASPNGTVRAVGDVVMPWSARGFAGRCERNGVPESVYRTLTAWRVDSLPQLASQLGEKWIWFDNPDTAAHRYDWPPLVSLAIQQHSFAALRSEQLSVQEPQADYGFRYGDAANTSFGDTVRWVA